jgi:hypothetical protein
MEYLVTMTTHVPDGTPAEAVDDVRASPDDLAEALRRAAAAHGRHEEEIGHADPDWPDWYAASMIQERIGADRG